MDSGEVLSVGVLTPHVAPGPDVEMPNMAPGRVSVEVSRIATAPGNAGPTSVDGSRARAGAAFLDEAASALLPAADVLVVASTSSGYALGHDGEFALVERLHERWQVPVCAASLSAVSALRSRHVERVSLVHPPWFGPLLNDLGAEYFRSQGFEVVDARLATSSAGTASKPLAPSTTWSAGPDASFWRRIRSCCGPSSKAPERR